MRMGLRCVVLFTLLMLSDNVVAAPDYDDALTKSILFFEGQRSGKLPSNQRMTWRKDSGLLDGSDIGMDLVGGYYDAGDNLKFHFPMAFTITTLAWSVVEFGQFMGSEDLQYAQEAIQWGTDYLLKATSTPNVVVAGVGDPYADHDCWERPEDMDTPRTSYLVNHTHPGSEVSAEIAAALAASSIAFRNVDLNYSRRLLQRASEVFDFANNFRGSYNDSVGKWVCPCYCDWSGYIDELIWGAAWLYKATNEAKYWRFVLENMPYMPLLVSEFGWDSKHAGINVLVSQWTMNDSANSSPFVTYAEQFICSVLPDSPTKSATYSPGGLLFKPGGSNMQHPTALAFLVLVYATYLSSNQTQLVRCGNNIVATPENLVQLARSQVDYILGNNPLGMSYMVGYGNKFPQRIHHRGASLPSMDQRPGHMGCHDGTPYFETNSPNPNLLVGALSGGPDINDQYADDRIDFASSEPTTYINAPFVGLLAYFNAMSCKDRSKIIDYWVHNFIIFLLIIVFIFLWGYYRNFVRNVSHYLNKNIKLVFILCKRIGRNCPL